MFKKLSIRNKVLLFLLVVTLSLYLSVTYLFYQSTLDTTKKDALNKLETLSNIQYKRLKTFISHNKEKLKLLNNTPDIIHTIKKYNENKDSTFIEDLKKHLDETIENVKGIENLIIFDKEHNPIYFNTPDEKVFSHYKEDNIDLKEDIFTIYTNGAKKPIDIFFSAPIKDNKEIIGSLVLHVDIDTLNAQLKDYSGLGATGEVLMAYKHENKMVFFTPLRFKESPIIVDLDSDLAIPMNYALSKKQKIFEDASDYIGVPVVAISRYLEELNFGIVVKMNTDEVLSVNDELKLLITKLLVGLFILVIVASFVISNFITSPMKVQENLTKKAEAESLKKTLALSSGTIGVWEWSYTNNNLVWDEIMYQIYEVENNLDISSHEIFFESIDIEYREIVEKKLKDAKDKNEEFNIKFWITTKNGNRKYIHTIGKNEYSKKNETLRLVGISTDITDIHLQKEEILDKAKKLQTQKEEFETIFNYAQDGIVITDLDLNILNCNKSFLDITGYKKEEILSKSCEQLTTTEDKKRVKDIIEHVIKYNNYEDIQKSCLAKNDKKVSVNMGVSLLPDKKRLLLVIKDTTALKIMEDQAKLASMGEMIGNIAHQWRQPLSVITASASGLKLKYMLGNDVKRGTVEEFSTKIVEQAKYLSKTIDDFKNFIKGDAKFEKTMLKEIIDSSLSLTSATISNNNINLILSLKDDMEIIGNKNELQQAFINIINNAKDAIKENIEKDEDKYLCISTKQLSNDSLELEIYDNGGGVDEDIIHRIFEPYFTTKHQSVGTGLGLAMTYKIITQRHKQKISITNEQREFDGKTYKGASFKIVFKKFVT